MAGNGGWVGLGGGNWWRGQLHGLSVGLCRAGFGVVTDGLLVRSWSAASPTVGKVVVMSPSSVHASRLRKNLLESVVTYTICLVSRVFPDLEGPVSRKMTAPRILMLWLLAAYIFIVTGMRLCLVKPRRCMTCRLVRQLWQPVSAMTDIGAGFGGSGWEEKTECLVISRVDCGG